MRYDRYSLREVNSSDKEKKALKEFITCYLKIEIEEVPPFQITENSPRIKKFIGKIIGKIASELYEVIRTEATNHNIYTYEIQADTKAYKIFIRKEFDFLKETVLWKELLIFMMNSKENSEILDFIKSIEPLDFDIGMAKEYWGCFQNDLIKLEHIDELDTLYDGIEDKKIVLMH